MILVCVFVWYCSRLPHIRRMCRCVCRCTASFLSCYVYIYIHIYMHIYMYIDTYVNVYIYPHTHTQIHRCMQYDLQHRRPPTTRSFDMQQHKATLPACPQPRAHRLSNYLLVALALLALSRVREYVGGGVGLCVWQRVSNHLPASPAFVSGICWCWCWCVCVCVCVQEAESKYRLASRALLPSSHVYVRVRVYECVRERERTRRVRSRYFWRLSPCWRHDGMYNWENT